MFGPGYDPFLLHHYEQVCKDGSIKLKPSQAVDNLYDLSISYAYRLLKTKHAILNLRSGGAIRLDDVKDYENRKSIQKEQKYQISPSLSLSQYGED